MRSKHIIMLKCYQTIMLRFKISILKSIKMHSNIISWLLSLLHIIRTKIRLWSNLVNRPMKGLIICIKIINKSWSKSSPKESNMNKRIIINSWEKTKRTSQKMVKDGEILFTTENMQNIKSKLNINPNLCSTTKNIKVWGNWVLYDQFCTQMNLQVETYTLKIKLLKWSRWKNNEILSQY